MKIASLLFGGSWLLLAACQNQNADQDARALANPTDSTTRVKPAVVTQTVGYDSDDPAVWINPVDPSKSLILGTDKEADGALYVFNLDGKIQPEKVVKNLKRPNNVDVEYGLLLNGKPTDIAVVTERLTHKLRIFSLPDMNPVDGGGIEAFVGETGDGFRDLMGVALYKNKAGKIYAIVGRKTGPTNGSYLAQYLLEDNGTGTIKASLVRKFGNYSGKKEIESIAVDDELGYVYYSDEGQGVRQYFADPEKGSQELALFAQTGFAEDHEGISIYKLSDTTGYILVSDQSANRFHIFSREGSVGKPYEHQLLKIVNVSTQQSDGSETVSIPLNSTFQHGLFVAMSTDRTFQLYRWEDLVGKDVKTIAVK